MKLILLLLLSTCFVAITVASLDPTFSQLMNELDETLLGSYAAFESKEYTTDEIKTLLAQNLAKVHTLQEKRRCGCKDEHTEEQRLLCIQEYDEQRLSQLSDKDLACSVYQLAREWYSRQYRLNRYDCETSMGLLCSPYQDNVDSLGNVCRMAGQICKDSINQHVCDYKVKSF